MPSPTRPALARSYEDSSFEIAYAVRSYTNEGGFAVCDVRNPDNGFWADGCYVIGSRAKAINAPAETWDETINPNKHPLVVCGIPARGQGNPFVIDLLVPRISYARGVSANVRHDAASPRDSVNENGGSRVVIKEDGKVYVSAVKDVVVALGPDAVMRVSSEDADEFVTLSKPVYDYFMSLASAVNRLEALVSAMSFDLNTSLMSYVPLASGNIKTDGQTSFDFSVEELQAQALQVSSKSNKGVL